MPGISDDPMGVGISPERIVRVGKVYITGPFFLRLAKNSIYKQLDKKQEQLLLTGCEGKKAVCKLYCKDIVKRDATHSVVMGTLAGLDINHS